MKKSIRVILIVLSSLIALTVVLICVLQLIRVKGKNSFFTKNAINRPLIESTDDSFSDKRKYSSWQDDWVVHNGNIYDYNDDILTFLIMGIDKADEEVVKVSGTIDGGQADAIFLLVLNPHDRTIKIIGINRNTMTDVDIYDEYGNYVTTTAAQIAVQHGFGDGLEESCELERESVSRLFYSLPIHGYAAINMSAIPLINDAVGGVDVTPAYSFSAGGYDFTANNSVHLEGDMAFAYLKVRDTDQAGSSDLRLQRQKEYLSAFAKKTSYLMEDTPSIVTTMYFTIEKQMTTDLRPDEIVYLSTQTRGYTISSDCVYLLEGVTTVGDQFEEFYPDKEALYELMLDVFYEKVAPYSAE